MIPTRGPYSGESYRLFDDYNDVHVFVEDAGFENLYREVFRRCNLTIRKVFSKNGKDSVIKAAQTSNDKRCVYVVDRDWDDALLVNHALDNLVVLEKHSIENYLLDYSGFYAIVLADKPKMDIETIFSRNIFISIVNEVSRRLRPLFECFLAMQVVGDHRTGCSIKPGFFKENTRMCAPDTSCIAHFIARIGLQIPQSVHDYFAGEVLLDRGHGKYMLHFVWAGVRQSTNIGQLGMEQLKIRLAQTVDPEIFRAFCDEVTRKGLQKSNNRI